MEREAGTIEATVANMAADHPGRAERAARLEQFQKAGLPALNE